MCIFCVCSFFPCSFSFCWSSSCVLQGLFTKDKQNVESLEQLIRNKNLPESHQDSFKTGFTEGFMKAQALTQRTQGDAFFYLKPLLIFLHYTLAFINGYKLQMFFFCSFYRLCEKDTSGYIRFVAGWSVRTVQKSSFLWQRVIFWCWFVFYFFHIRQWQIFYVCKFFYMFCKIR